MSQFSNNFGVDKKQSHQRVQDEKGPPSGRLVITLTISYYRGRAHVLMEETTENNLFKELPIGAIVVPLSHLQYADDTIFFGQWSKQNISILIR